MGEDVLFNPGNAIASDINPNGIIKTAQIKADKRNQKNTLVMVKDSKNNKHLLFEVNDKEKDEKNSNHYKVEKKF
ncbi:hypothetical protein WR164_08380 [Philodulcilactobacillus myokoensis]|uniref:Uncharacterized protein n=1 Tax=Philodulcilactobacillus myokoensis TaxID=2929573 RepID=A0A9W6B2C7_9LACO|nr:hypothetical protein [Philodulcilactobacillus myokoensis]GLB46859.1 hypothetical protein WR164_08380 [Philodulcilactobacillus myokoensis]